jgi:uncharacterized membrane protein YgcG
VRRLAAAMAVVGWLLLVGGVGAVPASADVGESIASYDVTLTVRADGTIAVSEAIAYDFGPNERHGIFRTVPTRVPFNHDNDRVYDLGDVRVTSPTGAPTDVDRTSSGGTTTLRIGDPDATVSGRQDYVISYTVDAALNAFDDHDELYWNAIGDEWDVPIGTASVVVTTPQAATQQACFAGPSGSALPCGGATASGDRVTFTQPDGLGPFEALTVVVGLPKGAVTSTGPHLAEHYTLKRALTPTVLTGTLAGLLLVPGLAVIGWLLATRGRDRRYAGQTPGLAPVGDGPDEPVPLVQREPVAVQFQPPEGLRPGQIGTLLDEQANVVDVTATIVDLAVRGHLRIVELERPHWFTSRDWRLEKLSGGTGELLTYERKLYDGLFETGDQVLISSLKKKFAARMSAVQTALYQDVTAAGWFRGRPDKVRSGWRVLGVVLTGAGGWMSFALAHRLHWAPVGIAVTAVGITLLLTAARMPARTAKGSAVLAQARGFREYVRTAEAEQLRFEEGADIFSRYLPYAVVFGETDRWVRVFGPLAATSGAVNGVGWYAGPNGWDPTHFGESMNGFTSTAASSLAAATQSSSGGSGFSGGSSGGGGGGGGGGSW